MGIRKLLYIIFHAILLICLPLIILTEIWGVLLIGLVWLLVVLRLSEIVSTVEQPYLKEIQELLQNRTPAADLPPPPPIPQPPPPKYKCKHCSKDFDDETKLRRHIGMAHYDQLEI